MSVAPVQAADGIRIRGLRKAYGDTKALDGLDLVALPGEVLGVAGPNGAGKSTLVRILAGEEVADGGELRVDGVPWSRAAAAGLAAVVHQEPALFPNLTVGQNLLIGRERSRLLRPRLGAQERQLMSELDLAPVARRPLGTCTLATQQRTEIARALVRDARIFLFDEPNSALTDEESGELFQEVRRLAQAGFIVMLVSHRLSDLVAHSDRVAIIRDGRCARVLEGESLTEEAIAHQLVLIGDADAERPELEEVRAARSREGEDVAVALRLSGWRHRAGAFAAVDLDLRRGEIVALVGVEGAGGRELLRSLGGLEPTSGSLTAGGGRGRASTAYVPATRQLSLYTNLNVGDNVVSRLDSEIADYGLVLRRRRMRRLAREAVDRFSVRTRSIGQAVRSLSGGNQQKVAIAAALAKRPEVLLLEEPTRGVDIRSKREIYQLLRFSAADGKTVVMFCTEVPEVYDVADTVYVVSDGRLSEALTVGGYESVEALAGDISKLEQHGRMDAAP